jgi:hypothetical protein
MKTPWINTQPARPKEKTVFKSSTSKVPKKPIALVLKNIKEETTETGNDNRELDNIGTTNNPDVNNDIDKKPELSDRIDSKHVSKIEETTKDKYSIKPAVFADEMKVTSPAELTDSVHMYEQGKVCYLTKNSPFSVHVEIDDFLHDPICGDIVQNTFEYHDMNNKEKPEFDTKLFHTTTYYPEQPDCRLVCSNIHEIVFLTDYQNEDKNNKGNHYKSVVVPLHDSLFTKGEESKNNSYVHIRVPVVLGEYKIEICLEEHITFKEKIMRIKDISKEVVLTQFRLIPTVFSQTLNNGTRSVLKGNLFIEGYIHQKIEYTSSLNRSTESVTPLNQLYQKMAVELIIHILQVQQVRVKR